VSTAQAAATSLPVIDLSGLEAEVLFVGIGTLANDVAPSTSIVEAVKVFYVMVCERLAAQRCQVATHYTPMGG
jgi:hypothetical protein